MSVSDDPRATSGWIILPLALYRGERGEETAAPEDVRRDTPALLALPLDAGVGDFVPIPAEGVMIDWCRFEEEFGYHNEFNNTVLEDKPPEFLVTPECGFGLVLDFDGESATNTILGMRRSDGLDIDMRGRVIYFKVTGLTISGSGNAVVAVDIISPAFATFGRLFSAVQSNDAYFSIQTSGAPELIVIGDSSSAQREYWYRIIHNPNDGRIYAQYAIGGCTAWEPLTSFLVADERIARMNFRVQYNVPIGATVVEPGGVGPVYVGDFDPAMLEP
jgi:hypothetical protein